MLEILGWTGDSELDGDTHRVLEEYLIAPVRNLLAARDVKDPGNDTEQWKVILDSVEGDHDTCKHLIVTKICIENDIRQAMRSTGRHEVVGRT